MAAFRVGTTSMGARVWWDWQGAGFEENCSNVRDATDEEAALMEKVVWDNDTPADLDKLKQLIARI